MAKAVVQTAFNLPPDLHEKLQRVADSKATTMAAIVIELLEKMKDTPETESD